MDGVLIESRGLPLRACVAPDLPDPCAMDSGPGACAWRSPHQDLLWAYTHMILPIHMCMMISLLCIYAVYINYAYTYIHVYIYIYICTWALAECDGALAGELCNVTCRAPYVGPAVLASCDGDNIEEAKKVELEELPTCSLSCRWALEI